MTESIPQEELDNTLGIRLYLSEKYKSITGLGEHYTQENWDYVVAGYFSEDSVMPAKMLQVPQLRMEHIPLNME